ncbi:MAG: hypothetical protein HRT57_08040 [Crocinitomicaceae bacterium]|nr:hypothetical protein [Crocinitomicaceae bacterium]
MVNFLHVAARNKGLGMDLDTSFQTSGHPYLSMFMDDAAEHRAITKSFRMGQPRNPYEVSYQHRGYAHYAEIVNLFGWCALENFWYSESLDFENGTPQLVNNQDQDDRILRMSIAAGTDLRPLFHYYGIHPENPAALESDISNAGLTISSKLYDRLLEYEALIPMDSAEFMAHALERHPNGLGNGNAPIHYGIGFYYHWSSIYNATHGQATVQALNDILNLYFPNGAPSPADNYQTVCDFFETEGKVTGLVLEDNGLPIQNVEIILEDADPVTPNLVAYTDQNGYYEFNELLQGEYTLTQTQPAGFVSLSDYDNELDGDVHDTISPVDNQIGVTLEPGEDDNQNNFVELESDLSIEELNSDEVILYPVPAGELLNIRLNEELMQTGELRFEICTLLGQVIQEATEEPQPIITLDTSKLSSNQMYLLLIKDGQRTLVRKLFLK